MALEAVGVRHVALNLKYGSRPACAVMEEVGEHVLPALGGATTRSSHAPHR